MKAFLVDTEAWTKLTAFEPKLLQEDFVGMQVRFNPISIPVIRSPYIMATADYVEPLSIIKDFDRWWRTTLWAVMDRKQRESERRLEQSRDSSNL